MIEIRLSLREQLIFKKSLILTLSPSSRNSPSSSAMTVRISRISCRESVTALKKCEGKLTLFIFFSFCDWSKADTNKRVDNTWMDTHSYLILARGGWNFQLRFHRVIMDKQQGWTSICWNISSPVLAPISLHTTVVPGEAWSIRTILFVHRLDRRQSWPYNPLYAISTWLTQVISPQRDEVLRNEREIVTTKGHETSATDVFASFVQFNQRLPSQFLALPKQSSSHEARKLLQTQLKLLWSWY